MCSVSAVIGYGQARMKDLDWTPKAWLAFDGLIREAERFDAASGQPDCVDPEKQRYVDRMTMTLARRVLTDVRDVMMGSRGLGGTAEGSLLLRDVEAILGVLGSEAAESVGSTKVPVE